MLSKLLQIIALIACLTPVWGKSTSELSFIRQPSAVSIVGPGTVLSVYFLDLPFIKRPFNQNALSNVPECALPPVQSPSPLPDPISTVFAVVAVLEFVKFAAIWVTAPPMPSTSLHPVNARTWSLVGLAGSLTTIGASTIPVPAPPFSTHPTDSLAAYAPPGLARLTAYKYPCPSPRKILPELASSIGSVSTLLVWFETVTGQSALVISAGAPPPNTGVIL